MKKYIRVASIEAEPMTMEEALKKTTSLKLMK